MRILVLCHEYPPLGGGGGRVAQDLSRGFVQQGHQVKLITPWFKDLPGTENDQGVEIIRIKSSRSQLFRADLKAMLGFVWASFWKGMQTARQWKPDVIHIHFAVPGGAAGYAISLLIGIPYVLTAHLGDVPGGVPEKTGKWFRWIFPFTPVIWKKAHQVVAVSEFTRSLALKKYPVPIRVIPNGVDLDALDPGIIKANTPPVVVFAGRFVPQKNPLQIIRSLAEVNDLRWKAVLIGDGAMRPEIESEIDAHGLASRFTLPGWLKPEEVIEWFRKSDILFMPSLSEGLPVVGVQGLAMGLAMVLSDAGGNPELVVPGRNGYLIPQGKNTDYAGGLRSLLSNPQALQDARLFSRQHAKNFDLNAVVKSYLDVLQQAGAGREK